MNERLLLLARKSVAGPLERSLTAADYRVHCVRAVADATASVERLRPDAAIVQLGLPTAEDDPLEAAATITALGVPVILLADADDDAMLARAAATAPAGFLAHPVDDRQLRLTVRAALAGRTPPRLGTGLVSRRVATLARRYGIQLTESLFDGISDGVLLTDFNGKVLYANPSVFRLLGEPGQGIEDWSAAYEFLHADDDTPFLIGQLPTLVGADRRSRGQLEVLVRRRGATEGRFVNVQVRPLIDAAGVPAGVVTVLHDISASKKAEADLQDTVARYQDQNELMETVFDSISDGLIVSDRDGGYLVFNRSARNIMGKHIPGATLEERPAAYGMYLPDDTTTRYPAEELPLTRALRGESSDRVNIFIRNEQTPEGAYIVVSGRPLRDRAGGLKGGTILFRDVTEIRRARLALEETARQLDVQRQTMEATFESMSDGVLVFDTEGELVLANRNAHRIVGEGMLAKTDPARWHEGDGIFYADETTRVPPEAFPHVRAMAGEATDDMRVFIHNPRIPDGVHVSLDCRPMRDAAGRIGGAVLVARDQTASHRAEQALTNAFAHGRLEVLDTVVHNIGNAINSVSVGIGTVGEQVANDVLLRRLAALADAVEAHGDDWQEYLANDAQGRRVLPFLVALSRDFRHRNEEVIRTVERVARRVDHIVEIIRTQTAAHGGTMSRTDIDVGQAINEACNILRESIASRGIELDVRCERAPPEIRVQASNFHQLVINLVKNSMDAIDDLRRDGGGTARPRIAVECFVDADSVVIEVADNGIGIAPDDMKQIFLPGYTTKSDGMGLGLHSAANYVISSGGTIKPSSPGIGLGATMRVAWRTATILPSRENSEGAT